MQLFAARAPGRAGRCALARAAALTLAAGLAACTVGPDFHRPAVFTPASWFGRHAVRAGDTGPTPEPVDPRWWRALNDPVLSRLMARLPAGNLDVATATARLAQVRALRTAAGAAENPSLDAGAGYGRDRLSRTGPLRLLPDDVTTRAHRPFDLFEAGFDASWELDLWGRVRRGVEAADAASAASDEDRRAVLVTSEAELARTFIALRHAQQVLALLQARTERPVARSSLAEAQSALLAARLPPLRAEIAARGNAIALLLGAAPGALSAELSDPVPTPPVPPGVPVGVPSQLLQRRPDIRAAEARLHVATATIGVAEADFFPRVTLSGAVGFQGFRPSDLGSLGAAAYSVGPSLLIPLFSGGRLKGQLELRRAEQQEAAIAFQAAALGAFHDVDNALTAYAGEAERRTLLLHATEAARTAVAKQPGDPVARQTELDADLALADSTAALATAFVQLYKALGGGWEVEFPLPPAAS